MLLTAVIVDSLILNDPISPELKPSHTFLRKNNNCALGKRQLKKRFIFT
jgi:hypothetical protein